MNGYKLRLLGAGLLLLVLVGLLSGWSELFASGAWLATLVQLGSLVLGLALVYRGENAPPARFS